MSMKLFFSSFTTSDLIQNWYKHVNKCSDLWGCQDYINKHILTENLETRNYPWLVDAGAGDKEFSDLNKLMLLQVSIMLTCVWCTGCSVITVMYRVSYYHCHLSYTTPSDDKTNKISCCTTHTPAPAQHIYVNTISINTWSECSHIIHQLLFTLKYLLSPRHLMMLHKIPMNA